MPLEAGQTIGPYEVIDQIGAGGMGQVYRALDPRLDREVALKVLPEAFSEDADWLARFEREAKVLAALDHPSIATVHGLEKSETGPVLVMELVPGVTLEERLSRAPLPIDEALPLFRQIAEALEAAHDKGIVHRDLKPANIKLTPEDKVKVLDFGLAKALSGEPGSGLSSDLSQSPTAAFTGTRAGMILGTVPYMSPEQARGKPVDKRTDLWSFGCVLYESLTGKKPFPGETITDTIATIVKTEPMWDALPSDTPWRIRDLLKRCLRKDPAARLRDASAARLDIEDAVAQPSRSDSQDSARLPRAVSRSHLIPIIAAASMAALVTGLVVASWLKPEPPDVIRLDLHVPPDLELFFNRSAPVISPDGKNVVVRSVRGVNQLFLRRIDQADLVPIAGTEGGVSPFFSPDSEWVAFSVGGTLKKVPISGGVPVEICENAYVDRASWGGGGTIVFTSTSGVLMRVHSSGGTPSALTTLVGNEFRHLDPHVLPGAAGVVFVAAAELAGGPGNGKLVVASLDSGERRNLNLTGSNPVYVSSGHLVFAQQGTLLAVPFDPVSLEVRGAPHSLLDGVSAQATGETYFDVSRGGTLLTVTGLGEAFRESRLVWVDRKGNQELASEHVRNYTPLPSLSPDGHRVAVSIGSTIGSDIWILDLDRDVFTRFTFEGNFNLRPQWSPDETKVFFPSNRGGGAFFNIFSKSPDGSPEVKQLTTGRYRIVTWVSSDGNFLLFRQQGDSGSLDQDVGMLRLDDSSEPVLLLESDFAEHSGTLSPDDRWLAYVSNESGNEEVYVRRFPDLQGRRQVSTAGGSEPMWSHDGRELFYRNGTSMMSVTISPTEDEIDVGRAEVLFDGPYATGHYGGNPGANYDVSPDGRFLMVLPDHSGNPARLQLVVNWGEELKELVPVQ